MYNKRASLSYPSLLTLCLITSVISNNAGAEEGTLLIDNERGIDNTREPINKEIEDLNRSLKDFLKNNDTTATDDADSEVTPDPTLRTGPDKLPQEVITPEIVTPPAISEPAHITPQEPTPLPVVDTAIKPAQDKIQKVDVVVPEESEPTTFQQTPVVIETAPENPVEKTVSSTSELESIDSTWIPKDSDLRILEIRVEAYIFEDAIDAYQYKDVVLLPLGTLSEILDLAIQVDPDFASGFAIKESNTFTLDTRRGEVILKGISEKYNTDLAKTLDNDIYVDSSLLTKWLNMEFDIDLYASRVWIRSDEKLPFLARIDRENRIALTLSRLDVEEQNYPRHYEAYKNHTLPFVDQTLRLGQRFADAGNVTTYQSITYATADLLEHESAWYLSINEQDGFDDFRATFGRTDPDGDLLGILNANEYSFGHVVEPRVNLINLPGELEPGVFVSNYPVSRQVEYDRHRFVGDLLPGWEIELYRNNALIGYQQTAVDGQYDFQDVPLLFGSNHFRLVFYGPRGEIKEENRHFQLSQSLTQQGKHFYRASSTADDIGGNRTTAQYDYGINKNISSSLNFVSIPLQETTSVVQHSYLSGSLTGYWDALLASVNLVNDSAGGSAAEIDLQTRIENTIIGFNDVYLSDFFSEEYQPSEIKISRSSSLRLDTAIPPSLLPRIPVTFGFKRDKYAAGGELFEITNQLSVSTRGVAITNQLTSQRITGLPTTLNGSFQLSTNIEQIRIRNIVSYELKPDNELTNIALTMNPGQYEDYRMSFGINHSLQQDLTEYSATANKVSGDYNLSFGLRYNSNNEINIDVGLSIGFGYEPRRKRWEPNSRTLANNGSISARFFLDTDQDGIFGENDEPIEEAGVRLNGGYYNERSDEDGILFLTGLQSHEPTNVVIAPETLLDPLWTVALDGIRLVPRPGHAIQVDFPVFMSGEIDGTVYLKRDSESNGVGRVTIELVNDANHVISSTETAYDGFFIINKIPLGNYRVRVSPKQLESLGLRLLNEEEIEITSENPFVNGVDFSVEAIKN